MRGSPLEEGGEGEEGSAVASAGGFRAWCNARRLPGHSRSWSSLRSARGKYRGGIVEGWIHGFWWWLFGGKEGGDGI